MSSGDTGIKLNGIKNQLKAIEKQCNSSSLFIYTPKLEHRQFINDLCRIYLDAPHRERWLVRDAVSGSKGVLNCLLGHVYESAKQVLSTGSRHRSQTGFQGNWKRDTGSLPHICCSERETQPLPMTTQNRVQGAVLSWIRIRE